MGYENYGEILPGVTLMRTARSKYLIARIYRRDIQQTLNRSTGCLTEEDARNWAHKPPHPVPREGHTKRWWEQQYPKTFGRPR